MVFESLSRLFKFVARSDQEKTGEPSRVNRVSINRSSKTKKVKAAIRARSASKSKMSSKMQQKYKKNLSLKAKLAMKKNEASAKLVLKKKLQALSKKKSNKKQANSAFKSHQKLKFGSIRKSVKERKVSIKRKVTSSKDTQRKQRGVFKKTQLPRKTQTKKSEKAQRKKMPIKKRAVLNLKSKKGALKRAPSKISKSQMKRFATLKLSAKKSTFTKVAASKKAAKMKSAVQKAHDAKSVGNAKNAGIAAMMLARKAKKKRRKSKVKIGSRKMAKSELVHEEGRPAKLPEVLNGVKLNSYIKKMMAQRQVAAGVALNSQSAKSMDALMKLLLHRFTNHASQSMAPGRKTLTDTSIKRSIKKLLPRGCRALKTRMLEEGQKAVDTFKKERKQRRLERKARNKMTRTSRWSLPFKN